MFADDLKIYAYVDGTDIDSSTSSIQSDINHLYKTAKSWGLKLNIKKCAPFASSGVHTHWTDPTTH